KANPARMAVGAGVCNPTKQSQLCQNGIQAPGHPTRGTTNEPTTAIRRAAKPANEPMGDSVRAVLDPTARKHGASPPLGGTVQGPAVTKVAPPPSRLWTGALPPC